MNKATYEYTFYEDNIKYCGFKYRDHTYEVCYNAFYCWKSPSEQHKEYQREIDRLCEKETLIKENHKSTNIWEDLNEFFKDWE